MNSTNQKIENVILNSEKITKNDIFYLLTNKDETINSILFEHAAKLKNINFGEQILRNAKICISNYCTQNCKFCFCKQKNRALNRYRLDSEVIINFAKKISTLGIKSIILKSGVDSFFNTDMISHIIYTIKNESDVKVTLSLCEREKEEYNSWTIAGADNYLFIYGLNDKYIDLKKVEHEEDIIKFSEFQKKNISVSVELIVGVPEQQKKEISKILLMLKNTKFESLIVTPYTSFINSVGNEKNILQLTKKIISTARLIMPKLDIFTPLNIIEFDKPSNQYSVKQLTGNNGIIIDFSPNSKNYTNLIHSSNNKKLIYS